MTRHPNRPRRLARWLGGATLWIALPAVGGAATFTVGSDPACSHENLQLALVSTILNGSSPDTIRLARNTGHVGEFLVDNQSVFIEGGYDDCADDTPFGRTVVTRAFDERALTISGTVNGPQVIELVDLDVRFDGGVSAVQNEGGTIHVSGGHSVTLRNTNVDGGTAMRGGGIFVDGSTLDLRESSTIVFNDASLAGGGIACANGGELRLTQGGVALNTSLDGGGVHVGEGCLLIARRSGPGEGIVFNQATGDGGGIHAVGGSEINVFGDSQYPGRVESNQAQRGGGIYLGGAATVGWAAEAHVRFNHATDEGGGVFVDSGATFNMYRQLATNCHDPVRCSRLSDNVADSPSATLGSAIMVDGGLATIAQTYVENNVATVGYGGVAAVRDGELRLEGDVFANNVADPVIVAPRNALITAAFITSTGNTAGDGQVDCFYARVLPGSTLRLYSSVLWDAGVPMACNGEANDVYDCLMIDSLGTTVNPATATVAGVDPQFADPAGGDFHLLQTSTAIDYCDAFVYAPSRNDLDHEERGWDWGGVPNNLGPFDLGADEFRGLPIFSDGFETGSTSRWSSTVP